ncbi:MAG: phosphodiesterase [Alphaproteobacteria bacterium]|nr:phosphodiesterase [Alphaproteobacteria bacterium]
MLKFVHLTDPHLVPAPRPLYALDPRERLALAVDDINRKQPDAAFVVVTGDLAHLGEAAAYAELRVILERLSMPCHLVIGNHDSREEFLAAFPDSPRDENGFVQYVVETPLADCVMLDSVVAGDHGGMMCEQRLAWLDRVLSERADRDLFLFVHHPPFDIGLPPLDSIRMMNGEALAPRLAAHGRVRHIFFGHAHRAISGSWHGIPVSTLPATAHQSELQFRERVLSPGNHEPPAYGLVLASADSLMVHTHFYMDDSPRFIMDHREAEEAATLADLAAARN